MTINPNKICMISLQEYFSSSIEQEAKHLDASLSREAAYYLTQMLVKFSAPQHLFSIEDGRRFLPTLATLYEKAYKAPSSFQRNKILRKLGDSALFMGAVFFEHFSRKGINKDYFIGMGSGAYSSLGGIDPDHSNVFTELANAFPILLQIIAAVCSVENKYNAEDIFSLLERWKISKEDVLRRQLMAIGITPIELTIKH